MAADAAARNTSYGQAALNVLGAALSFGLWNDLPSPALKTFQWLTLASGLLTAVLVRVQRDRWTVKVSSIAFIANLVPMFVMLWLSHAELARLERYWAPFQAHKLSVLALALLAPARLWVGLFSIVALTVMAWVQNSTFTPEQLRWMSYGEPWPSLAFGIFAIVLLLVRFNERRLHEKATRLAEEARMMAQLARSLLAIRDLANTPVQTLLLDVELLKRTNPEAADVAARMGHSVEKLRELSRLLSMELKSEVRVEDYGSLNAEGVLRELMK